MGIGRYTTPQVIATGPNPTVLQRAYMSSSNVKDVAVACAGDHICASTKTAAWPSPPPRRLALAPA